MDVSADVAAIVAQAPEWNFAGDCALLDLMKRISQNLQEHGERTNRSLIEFETNVRRVDIALDNATNSLRSLQFGQQFVEYRVEEVDDDDFVLPEEQNKKPTAPLKSSQEMATEFLQNNLQMFRKNFEPVTIEVPDSDDEDGAANTTTIFRAKNPYDNIPLPYIIGSRQWEEHKYAGLYDSAENSENEEQEQFSSSSSDEMETAVQKTHPKRQQIDAQQSDSSSLASLPRELANVAAINQAKPATLQPAQPVAAAAVPRAQPRPIISSRRNAHESDLFAALRESPPSDEPPSTSSSPTSSPGFSHRNSVANNLPRAEASLSSSSSSASKPIVAVRQTPTKLFEEPAAAPVATPIQTEAEVKPVAAASQIKRKPVNLFNDDEFNSFMSEIVHKVQAKSEHSSNASETVGKAKETPKLSVNAAPKPTKTVTDAPSAAQPSVTTPKKQNLFDDSPPLSPQFTPKTKPTVAAAPAKVLPKSLFDDNLEDDDDDFLSSFTSKTKPQQQAIKTSLFDDDDDDLDIDDIFVKKTLSTQPHKVSTKAIGKTSLFDDEEDENANDIFGATAKQTATQKVKPQQPQAVPPVTTNETPSVPKKSIFDDLGDDDLFGTPKSSKNLFAEEQKQSQPKPPSQYVEVEPPEDVAAVPKHEEQILIDKNKVQETKQEVSKASKSFAIPKTNLFSDDFSDDEPITTAAAKQADQATETIEITKPKEAANNAAPIKEIAEIERKLPNKQTEPMNNKYVENALMDMFKNLEEPSTSTAAETATPQTKESSTSRVAELPTLKSKESQLSSADETFTSTAAELVTPKSKESLTSRVSESLTSTSEDTPIPRTDKPPTSTDKESQVLAADESSPPTAEESSTLATAKLFTPRAEESPTPRVTELHISTDKDTPVSRVDKPPTPAAAKPPILKTKKPETSAAKVLPTSTATESSILLAKELPTSTAEELSIPTVEETLIAEEPPEDKQQDPIISLVAEVTNKKSSADNQTAPPDSADLEAAEQLMKNYTSIFSDEPPDDSDFFQSLGNSSLSSLSASKMFDNEPDFFEPTLPDIPKAVVSTANTVEQPNNDYAGIRLFSDVPPDDDDDDDEAANLVPAPQPKATATEASTKRIHTIFYDDFSETARAVAAEQPVQPTAIFDEEPPTDVVDRSASQKVEELPKPTSPVKKLQMPNININVKALLPGSGGLPKFAKKQQEEQVQEDQVQQDQLQKERVQSTPIQQSVQTSSAEADNILQCVSKNRVRGPAHRRPSTRRARQENYAKSLQEEQVDKSKEEVKAAPARPSILVAANKQDHQTIKKVVSSVIKPAQSSTHAASFLESDDSDDDALFNVVKKLPVDKPRSFIPADLPPEDDFKPVAKTVKLAPFFLDSDEEDNGIFDRPLPSAAVASSTHIKPKSAITDSILAQKPAEVEPKPKAVATQASKPFTSFLDSDDELNSSPFGLTNSLGESKPAAVAPKQPPKDDSKPIATFGNTTKHFTSFLDNDEVDDDEDALFMPAAKTKANTSTLAAVVATSAAQPFKDELKSKVANTTHISKPMAATAATVNVQPKEAAQLAAQSKSNLKKSTLFDESDDDDDLFGKAATVPISSSKSYTAPAPAAVATISKPKDAPRTTATAAPSKSALFDSDSEQEAPPKVLSSKAKMLAKSKSLFSDDEDDDDLFGSGAGSAAKAKPVPAKARNVVKSAPSKVIATPVPAQPSTADNPLADLLGP